MDNGEEKEFLAPLAVRKIPGVGKETTRKLQYMGVKQVKTLSEVPIRLLEREFGKHGRSLWQKANGIDNTPVVPYTERKSLSKERTFKEDTIDIAFIKNLLVKMVDQLAYELRSKEKLTSCITIKIRYADFNTYTRQIKIAYTANENILGRYAKEIFDKVYERRQMIRLIGVKFSGLVQGKYQISLFDDTVEDKIMRASSMNDMVNRVMGMAS